MGMLSTQRGSHRVQANGSQTCSSLDWVHSLQCGRKGMPLLLPSPALVALELRGSLEAAKGLTETEAVLATLWTVVWLVLWQPLVSLKSCNCSWSVLGRARSWTLLLVGPFQLRLFCDPWQGFSMKGWVQTEILLDHGTGLHLDHLGVPRRFHLCAGAAFVSTVSLS